MEPAPWLQRLVVTETKEAASEMEAKLLAAHRSEHG